MWNFPNASRSPLLRFTHQKTPLWFTWRPKLNSLSCSARWLKFEKSLNAAFYEERNILFQGELWKWQLWGENLIADHFEYSWNNLSGVSSSGEAWWLWEILPRPDLHNSPICPKFISRHILVGELQGNAVGLNLRNAFCAFCRERKILQLFWDQSAFAHGLKFSRLSRSFNIWW